MLPAERRFARNAPEGINAAGEDPRPEFLSPVEFVSMVIGSLANVEANAKQKYAQQVAEAKARAASSVNAVLEEVVAKAAGTVGAGKVEL